MKIDKKTGLTILLIFVIGWIILELLRNFSGITQVLDAIRYFFLFLFLIPSIIGIISIFSQKLRESKWFKYISDSILFYYAAIIILMSINSDIIPIIPRWNISMTGLGFAVFALGWALYPQRKKPQRTETLEALNKKFRKAEKVIDAFLEESQKFAKQLSAIQKEEKRKR